ncbi:hypothetical protein NDU88_000341 [Pleurodeles waltl]|uniref:Uncharacterized protein n=1 Tax=Pleurodeles waltl TaxID=8319 RepID=A0AAV7VVU4_PLEWA|nr:hypothetical protein NDU88_000341 [Pleurodeles waltl]
MQMAGGRLLAGRSRRWRLLQGWGQRRGSGAVETRSCVRLDPAEESSLPAGSGTQKSALGRLNADGGWAAPYGQEPEMAAPPRLVPETRLQESGDPVLSPSRSGRRGQFAGGTKDAEECLKLPQCKVSPIAGLTSRWGPGLQLIPGPHTQGSWTTSAEPSILIRVGRVQGDRREGGYPRERRDRDLQ